MSRLEKWIEDHQIFSQLGSAERGIMCSAVIRKNYRSGEAIANFGEPWPFIFLVGSGQVDVLKFSPQGRSLGTLSLVEGDLFWSPSFIDQGPLPARLEAKKTCQLLLWERRTVLPLLQRNPEALWGWVLLLAERIRLASEFIEEVAFHPLAGRLAHFLLEQFEVHDGTRVDRELTLDEMSARINTSPVMVCKMLSRFAEDGMIKVSRTSFELLDRSALENVRRPRG